MMNNNMIKKWESLLSTITVAKTSGLICSEAEIDGVEKELGFKFPAGYKEYSRVFGSGSLGQSDAPNFFRVYSPCCPRSSVDIRQTGYNLIGLKLDLEASEPIEDADKAKLLHRLLESGYAFADSDRADRFIWDLTTYREEDQSYDIYWIPDENVEGISLIGRDFFEFIDKFCLGANWRIMFPDEKVFDMPDTQERFFTAFEQYDENDSEDSFAESMFESLWAQLAGNVLLTEMAEVKLECSYDAPGKEEAECLQIAWSRVDGVEIEIIQPSNRPNIPRLVQIAVTSKGREITREFVDGLLRKMIKVGEECNCLLTGFGSSIHPEN
jgi:hypothetical protein